MENLPEVRKCCNCIPLKVGQCCIAFIALITGGSGLTIAVMLALWEEHLTELFGKIDESIKWPIIGLDGFFSSLLTLSGLMFLFGPCMRKSHATVLKFGFMIVMCMTGSILLITIGPILTCVLSWFYLLDSRICMKDFMSAEVLLLLALSIFVFVSAWCYYGIAIANYINRLNGV